MTQSALLIARYTFLEAVRNRLFTVVLVGLVCLLGLTEFVGELAITETRQIQGALTAYSLRMFTVAVISLFVVTTMIREFNDKGFEMLLSLAITRGNYYFGKFAGFALLALIIVLAASLILVIYCPFIDVMYWSCSLACEALLIIALSLLCLFTFNSITTAYIAVMAFYLLSRGMYVIQLISASPIVESKTFSQAFMNFLLDAIAFILPDLNLFTSSEWLLYGADFHGLTLVLLQTAIYVTLLIAAGLFDLYRKEF